MEKFAGIAEFVATVEAGSFAQAAHRLGMTPSGVGKAVSRLENRLGLRLLTRSTRRLVVTEAGAECHQRFRQFLFDLDEMEMMWEPTKSLRGTLRVHMAPALARILIMPALPAFSKAHPGMTLQISLRNDMLDPIEEGVDLSVRVGRFDGANVISRRVGAARYVTVCSPIYAKSAGIPSRPEELLQHNCLRFFSRQTGRPCKWTFVQKDIQVQLALSGNLVLNNSDGLIEAAVGGLGIAQVPYYAAQGPLGDGRLIEILEPYAAPPRDVIAVYSVAHRSSRKVNAFIDFLRDALKPRRPRPHEAWGFMSG
ncbi:LysR family transcriptional regulator [Pigmentiphaga soli]|uniref:LysR family transcriptional regulator n=1 Tax=Pigmentiphaga soli TaxID=1007095 RepID=A0ABP8H874_9BURK